MTKQQAKVLDLRGLRPFKQYAIEYLDKGWFPLPLPSGQKFPPPSGYTGHHDPPTLSDVQSWIESIDENCNIAIRMPDGVVGIDVDAYEEKIGATSLKMLVNELGPLPPTWTLTARADGVSGIRFFRVPPGLILPGEVAADIQVVQHRHRYAVAWPSIHPSLKKMYRWYAPGSALDGKSFCDDIPDIS